jgi:division protein CdvB (Snf7/Vps24/ESCRT-III family)
MRIKEFKYKKKSGEIDEYKLVTLNESTDYIVGIDMNKLDEEEKEHLEAIMEKFSEDIKPFMKAYRKFIVENIINEESTE